ncbi:hypothetical protein ACKS23_10837 [Histoplasma ohiense]
MNPHSRLEYWKSGTSGSEFAASMIPGFFFFLYVPASENPFWIDTNWQGKPRLIKHTPHLLN